MNNENLQYSLQPLNKLLEQYEKVNITLINSVSNTLLDIIKMFENIEISLCENQYKLAETLSLLGGVPANFKALEKLGDNQFIWFKSLDKGLVEKLNTSENTNHLLDEYIKKGECFETDEIIKAIKKSSAIKKRKLLFSQSITAYRNKHYLLGCVGLISIIDIFLSQISGDATTKFMKKVDYIVKQACADEVLNDYDAKYFYMSFGIERTLKTLFDFSDFTKDEPNNIRN